MTPDFYLHTKPLKGRPTPTFLAGEMVYAKAFGVEWMSAILPRNEIFTTIIRRFRFVMFTI